MIANDTLIDYRLSVSQCRAFQTETRQMIREGEITPAEGYNIEASVINRFREDAVCDVYNCTNQKEVIEFIVDDFQGSPSCESRKPDFKSINIKNKDMKYLLLTMWFFLFMWLTHCCLGMISQPSTIENIAGFSFMIIGLIISIKTRCLTNLTFKRNEK